MATTARDAPDETAARRTTPAESQRVVVAIRSIAILALAAGEPIVTHLLSTDMPPASFAHALGESADATTLPAEEHG
jgi:hypothetical protein